MGSPWLKFWGLTAVVAVWAGLLIQYEWLSGLIGWQGVWIGWYVMVMVYMLGMSFIDWEEKDNG